MASGNLPFGGLRVLSLESRRADEMATLIRKQGGEAIVAPSMREVPLEENDAAFEFGEQLLAGDFDCIILLTGVGTRMLWKTLLTRYAEVDLKAALGRVTRIVRGPKPSLALRELGLLPDVQIPEPNTWREILAAMQGRPEMRVAVQEYGQRNEDLVTGLEEMGKQVTTVRIYGWALPDDTKPLRAGLAKLVSGQVDVAMFTTSVQVVHLMQIAAEEGVAQQAVEALQSVCVASIGPTTTETLGEFGVRPDFEPSHPKMGLLVNEVAGKATAILAGKQ